MIKAVFFDIDGTLVNSQTGDISPNIISALCQLKSQGIKIFVSTGRGRRQLIFLDGVIPFDGYVTLNGQLCYQNNYIIYKNSINRNDIAVIVEQAKQHLYPCFFIEQDRMYANMEDERVKQLCQEVHIVMPEVREVSCALNSDVFQLWAFLERGKEDIILSKTNDLAITRWHEHIMDVVPKGGNKAQGMAAILKYFGISPEETMAFGDGENDIEMLQYVKLGVAMGNAGQKIKECADYITDDVEHDGVVTALKHFQMI